jgi:1-acyl-sn-glycerol-3-phosphate acyltransferase
MVTVQAVLRTLAALAVTPPVLAVALGVKLVWPSLGQRLFLRWCGLSCRILGIRVHLRDENGGVYDDAPYVFVLLNQTSLAESVVWPPFIPVPYKVFANLEFLLLPLLGWITWTFSIPVVRQWRAQARRAIGRAEEHLKKGGTIVISIEGRRSRDGSLSEYKKGPVVMALATGATLLPYSLEGARERLPYGSWVVRPGEVTVTFHRPIPTRGLGLEQRHALVAELRTLAERVCRRC